MLKKMLKRTRSEFFSNVMVTDCNKVELVMKDGETRVWGGPDRALRVHEEIQCGDVPIVIVNYTDTPDGVPSASMNAGDLINKISYNDGEKVVLVKDRKFFEEE